MRTYEYHHIVGFEDTNLVGNVYYANHVRWQGRVREMFLRDHAPDVLTALANGLSLVTTRVACEYYAELFVFDEVIIRMRADAVTQNRVTMRYDYLRANASGTLDLMARGEQQIASMRHEGARLVPTPLPNSLHAALGQYMVTATDVA